MASSHERTQSTQISSTGVFDFLSHLGFQEKMFHLVETRIAEGRVPVVQQVAIETRAAKLARPEMSAEHSVHRPVIFLQIILPLIGVERSMFQHLPKHGNGLSNCNLGENPGKGRRITPSERSPDHDDQANQSRPD